MYIYNYVVCKSPSWVCVLYITECDGVEVHGTSVTWLNVLIVTSQWQWCQACSPVVNEKLIEVYSVFVIVCTYILTSCAYLSVCVSVFLYKSHACVQENSFTVQIHGIVVHMRRCGCGWRWLQYTHITYHYNGFSFPPPSPQPGGI